jgi:hypothetical protein
VACDQSDEMNDRIARNALTFLLTAKATLEPTGRKEERQKSDHPSKKRLARKKGRVGRLRCSKRKRV